MPEPGIFARVGLGRSLCLAKHVYQCNQRARQPAMNIGKPVKQMQYYQHPLLGWPEEKRFTNQNQGDSRLQVLIVFCQKYRA